MATQTETVWLPEMSVHFKNDKKILSLYFYCEEHNLVNLFFSNLRNINHELKSAIILIFAYLKSKVSCNIE